MRPGIAERLRSWPPYVWVGLMMAVFFAASLAGTWVNYVGFHLNGIGIYDLSINQQALSSTAHSNYPYPFYEAPNCGRNDRCSFLLVHPSFIAYIIAVPYGYAPSAFTLFAIQDFVLALAALPLFAIARKVTKSDKLSLVAVATYLVWWPSFSGVFSFHWEAFIPLMIFTVFWLWLTKRYWLAIPVILLAYVTLEIVPVLLFFVALFFLVPWLYLVWRWLRTEWQLGGLEAGPERDALENSVARVRRGLFTSPGVIPTLLLLVSSAVAYVLLHEFVASGGALLGRPPLPPQYILPLTQPVAAEQCTIVSLETSWQTKVVFWLVIYATLAMIPLLVPRTFILMAPWIVYSIFGKGGFYGTGNQYAFISASLIFIGFVYGLARLQRWVDGDHEWWERRAEARRRRPLAAEDDYEPEPEVPAPAVEEEKPVPSWAREWLAEIQPPPPTQAEEWAMAAPEPDRRAAPSNERTGDVDAPPALSLAERAHRRDVRQRRAAAVVVIVLTAVIGFNLFFNPLNPYAADVKAQLGRPFAVQAGDGIVSGLNSSSYNQVEQLVSIIGPKGVVAVSPLLFTFLASDPFAYPLDSGMNFSFLPYDAINGTQYVLLLLNGGATIPPALTAQLYNSSAFMVRAWIPNTYLGGILLFQYQYKGPVETLGSPPALTDGIYTAATGLDPGPTGVVVLNSSASQGIVIESSPAPKHPGESQIGRVFAGPGIALPAGEYNISVALSRIGNYPALNATNSNTQAASIRLAAYETTLAPINLPLGWFPKQGGWQNYSFSATFTGPVLNVYLTGFNDLQNWTGFQVDWVSIVPVTPLPTQPGG